MLEIILIAAVIAIDQVSKYLIQLYLSPVGASLPLINGIFQLTNAHNTGAAWGLLPGFRWMFIPLTILVCAAIVFVLIRFHKKLCVFSRITLALLLAGAVGNLVDRIALSYVRDMFDFCLINFPVFNVADSSLTIGCILLVVDALFLKDRSIFERVSFSKKSETTKPVGDGGDA